MQQARRRNGSLKMRSKGGRQEDIFNLDDTLVDCQKNRGSNAGEGTQSFVYQHKNRHF